MIIFIINHQHIRALFRMFVEQTSTSNGQGAISYWFLIGREPREVPYSIVHLPPAVNVECIRVQEINSPTCDVICACYFSVLLRLCLLPLYTYPVYSIVPVPFHLSSVCGSRALRQPPGLERKFTAFWLPRMGCLRHPNVITTDKSITVQVPLLHTNVCVAFM
jgi:hypothetical protein